MPTIGGLPIESFTEVDTRILKVKTTFEPFTDTSSDIGNPSKRFKNAYIETLNTQTLDTGGGPIDIQAELDSKLPLAGGTMTGPITDLSTTNLATIPAIQLLPASNIQLVPIDTERVAFKNFNGLSSLYTLGPTVVDTTPAAMCIGTNLGVFGCYGMAFFYAGTDDTVPGTGAWNSRGSNNVAGRVESIANYYADGSVSFANEGLFYYRGDRAGVGLNGLEVTDGTESTSSATGAVRIPNGGLGVGGDLWLDGTLNGLTPSNGVYSGTAQQIVQNTTDELSLLSLTSAPGSFRNVPANTFKVGDTFTFALGGSVKNVNNETLDIRFYAGALGNTLFGAIPQLILPLTTDQPWNLDVVFHIRQVGTAGVAVIVVKGLYSQAADVGNKSETQSFNNVESVVFDTTLDNLLDVKVKWGTANANNVIRQEIDVLHKIF